MVQICIGCAFQPPKLSNVQVIGIPSCKKSLDASRISRDDMLFVLPCGELMLSSSAAKNKLVLSNGISIGNRLGTVALV